MNPPSCVPRTAGTEPILFVWLAHLAHAKTEAHPAEYATSPLHLVLRCLLCFSSRQLLHGQPPYPN
jgi:hypothetical protein